MASVCNSLVGTVGGGGGLALTGGILDDRNNRSCASTTKVVIIRDRVREPELVRFGAALDFPTLAYLGDDQRLLVGNQALNMAGRNQSRLVIDLKQQAKRRGPVLPVEAFVDVPGRPLLVVDAVAAILAYS